MNTIGFRTLLVLVVAQGLACGTSSSGPADAGADAIGDVAADAAGDAALPDTVADAALPDTVADAALPDAGTDAALPDAGADAALPDAATDTPVGDVTEVTFSAVVKDFQLGTPVANATVTLMDNATGQATTTTATSGADGTVTFQLPSDAVVGFKITADLQKETYMFNVKATDQGRTLYSVSESTFTLAPALADLTPDATKGVIAGSILFGETQREPVGCATVESTPAGEYRYFPKPAVGAPTLPAPLADAPQTSKDNGYFLGANVAPGKVTIKAMIGGAEVGTVDIFAFADAICITDIFATGAANPTPAACTY